MKRNQGTDYFFQRVYLGARRSFATATILMGAIQTELERQHQLKNFCYQMQPWQHGETQAIAASHQNIIYEDDRLDFSGCIISLRLG